MLATSQRITHTPTYLKPRAPQYKRWTIESMPPPFHWDGGDSIRVRPIWRVWPAPDQDPNERGRGIYICKLLPDPDSDNEARQYSEEDVVCVGPLDGYTPDTTQIYDCKGTWEFSRRKTPSGVWTEWQIKVEAAVVADVLTLEEITEFLLGITHFGMVRVRKMMKWAKETGGDDVRTLSMMDNLGMQSLVEADLKLTPAQQIEAWASYQESRGKLSATRLLNKVGIMGTAREKIIDAFGTNLKEAMQKAPERVLGIDTIDFPTARKLWLACGLEAGDLRIIACGLSYTMSLVSREGHCWCDVDAVLKGAAKHLKLPALAKEWRDNCYEEKPEIQRLIVVDEFGHMWPRYLYEAEVSIAHKLAELATSPKLLEQHELDRIAEYLDGRISTGQLTLDETQRNTVLMALGVQVSMIRGTAGTGKSTLIKALIEALDLVGIQDVNLLAYTGKASENATKRSGGFESTTIHSALEPHPGSTTSFRRNAENPLVTHCVIIDEMSMLDLVLFRKLLDAIPTGALLIMVGDHRQLPPIGPGAVMRDIMLSNAIPVFTLTQTYRQKADSNLLDLFDAVLNKRPMQLVNTDGTSIYPDITAVDISGQNIAFRIKEWILEKYSTRADPDALKFITYRKGKKEKDPWDATGHPKMVYDDGGVMALNRWIVDEFYAPDESEQTFSVMGQVVCAGHRGLWLTNIYEEALQMRNGKEFDLLRIYENPEDKNKLYATIQTTNGKGVEITYEIDLRKYDADFMLGYAITIHKAQGSEWDEVVIVIRPGDKHLLTVQGLYTALSRARTKLSIIGDLSALWLVEDEEFTRQTNLAERIAAAFIGGD